MKRREVYQLLDEERDYQEGKFPGHRHELGAYFTLLQFLLRKAIYSWAGDSNDEKALSNLRKLVALGIACLEEHGAPSRVAEEDEKRQMAREARRKERDETFGEYLEELRKDFPINI